MADHSGERVLRELSDARAVGLGAGHNHWGRCTVRVAPDHWLPRVRRVPSPNCDARFDADDIALLVIHNISLPAGRFGNGHVEALFCNELDCTLHASFADLPGVEVSAHLLIARTGRITQFVPFNARAWHAGTSQWRGRSRCNDFSIGIELEGTDSRPYTKAQYRSLTRVTAALLERYPRMSPDAIVGHEDIAPGRKTDPGPAFDWSRYLGSLG
ncbi:MAG: 1,6-anhydro-N-acetylmuramyl-L-alanine amidase AmpD [Pseudomonadales bacterium]